MMRHEPTSGHDDPELNYRVTWKTFNFDGPDGEHERIFTDRDQAWSFYEDAQKGKSYGATWEHIPA